MSQTFITRTGPTIVSVDRAKEHLRIIGDEDDAYLLGLIHAATSWAEHETDCILSESTVEEYYQRYQWVIPLMKQPVTEFISVEYFNDGWQPFTNYKKQIKQMGYSQICFNVVPDYDRSADDVIKITYKCMIQRDIQVAQQLVLMLVAQMYSFRELEVTGTIVSKCTGYEHLVRCLRPGGAL